MSNEWLSSTPAVPGWYPASTEENPRGRRHWDGTGWSAPVYEGDPREHWIAARNTPASALDAPIKYQNDQDVREQCARWLSSSPCPEDFVASQGSALSLLEAAAGHIRNRAAAYDKPQGERSMGQTVAAFNAVTGRDLSESEGWLLMELLKAVRDFTTPGGHEDSQEDRIAYAALGAEARRAGK